MGDNEVRKAIYNVLSQDAELVAMLGENTNWSQPEAQGV